MALPCRISIHEGPGKKLIDSIPPSVLLGRVSAPEELQEISPGMEHTTGSVIDDAV